MKLLLIEDNHVDSILFRKHMREYRRDIEIEWEESGIVAIQKIQENSYDCVFLDFMLPDIDGIEILKKLYCTQTELTPCPIVMLTGQGSHKIILEALTYGAQDYLAKNSISTDSLAIAIQKAQHAYNLKKLQNETQIRLNHAQKIEALGKFTGGIAHDFNNILTIILGNTKLLINKTNKDNHTKEDTLKKAETIERAAQRGADLVQHLMIFSHHRSLSPQAINIKDTLEKMREFLIHTIPKSIKIKLQFEGSLWPAHLDNAQLEHMIINMTTNARDAMPNGGTLTFSAKNTTLSKEQAEPLSIKAGDYVLLSIGDTGCGIPSDLHEKIFDPFFTTKDIGKGTGLGISTAYGFIKDSHGAIRLESAINKGTTFFIYLPRSFEEVKTPQVDLSETSSPLQNNNKTILLVEDEDEIREIAAQALRDQGYKVIESHNGDHALELLIKEKNTIDLLFTDIMMPGDLNGIELAARALELQKDLPLLFTTGFIKENTPDINLLSGYEILDKPYTPEMLITRISQALNSL